MSDDKQVDLPPALVEMFDRIVDQYPDADKRQHSGYPAAYMNGNLVCGLRDDRLMFRLSERDREVFLKIRGAKSFEAPAEDSEEEATEDFSEYVISSAALSKDEAELDRWLGKSFTYVSTLPDRPGGRNRPDRGNSIHSDPNRNRSNNNPGRNRGRKKSSKKTGQRKKGGSRKKSGQRRSRNRQSGQNQQ